MSSSEWNARWRVLEDACGRHHASDRLTEGEARPMRCRVDPPADARVIAEIERRLPVPLPRSLREVVSRYSACADIRWQLPEEKSPPAELGRIFAGEVRWDLSSLPALHETYASWLARCFDDPSDPYSAVWHEKFPILAVANGDLVGIELGKDRAGAVVYLSHDDGEGHGYLLGSDFEDYVDRLSRIGGVGAEDWQWLPFTSSRTSGIDPNLPAALRWRAWFGIGAT